MSHPIRRSITCEICNRRRQTQKRYDLCSACVRELPKMHCDACKQMRFQHKPECAICLSCEINLLTDKIVCGCGVSGYPFKTHPSLCRKCRNKVARRDWKDAWSAEVKCPSCGKQKRPFRKSDLICLVCYRQEVTADTQCVFPNCDRPVIIQKSQMCRLHHDNQRVPALLKPYFESYTSPFPQNRQYMNILASTVDWQAVADVKLKIRGRNFSRFRVFGTFLKTYELPEALTWNSVDEALAFVSGYPATKKQLIRSCLLQLGNVLGERGLMEDRESHLTNRSVRRSLERTPEVFAHQISEFQKWLAEGEVNPNFAALPAKTERLSVAPRTMMERVSVLANFLDFCAARNIVSLSDIGPSIVSEYQQTLLWEFECTKCHNRIPCTASRPSKTCVAAQCNAIDCYVKTRRLTRGTLISHMSALRQFFDWAKLRKLVTDNPISDIRCGGARRFTVRTESGEIIEVAESIRRYDDVVVEKLCAYIVSPDAAPEDAIILYLIIFHFLSTLSCAT